MNLEDGDADRTKEQPTQPTCSDPIEAVHDALEEMSTECRQFAVALSRGDHEDAELSANDAFSCWLVARGALQRNLPNTAVTEPQMELESLVIQEAGRTLDELLRSGMQQADSPHLRRALHQLRISLAVANLPRPTDAG